MITCEAGAVKVYRNEEEYKKLKTEYDDDAMTVEELFQDRFGAVSVDPKYKCDVKELDNLIADANKPLLIEFYNENEATCLVNSVPIRKILEALENKVSYRKIVVKDLLQIDKFSIIELPALILIDKKEIVYKREGFVNAQDENDLLDEIKTFNRNTKW